MFSRPSLQQWNLQSLAVVQALIGAPSPNFRRVTLDHDQGKWIIAFVLEHDDAADREEIADFAADWDAQQSGPEPREIQVVIAAGELERPAPRVRILYQRRESIGEAAD